MAGTGCAPGGLDSPESEDLLLPLLPASETHYIGVLGSRRAHAVRVRRLTAAGLSGAQVVRFHAPVGLDTGAVTPEEITASVVAERIALGEGTGPARADDPCPGLPRSM